MTEKRAWLRQKNILKIKLLIHTKAVNYSFYRAFNMLLLLTNGERRIILLHNLSVIIEKLRKNCFFVVHFLKTI